jgi:hypothetical protein
MDSVVARDVAQRLHAAQRTRFGDLVVDHLARVGAAIPEPARAVAWLHDALEGSGVTSHELQVYGLTVTELEALGLLTQVPSESYSCTCCGSPARAARPAGSRGRSSSPIVAARRAPGRVGRRCGVPHRRR